MINIIPLIKYSNEAEEVNRIAQSFGLTDNNEKTKS
jgi:hypothetical protein